MYVKDNITFFRKSSDTKVTPSDYEGTFLHLHAVLYLNQDITTATTVLQSITHALTPLIATQEFSSWKLVQVYSLK